MAASAQHSSSEDELEFVQEEERVMVSGSVEDLAAPAPKRKEPSFMAALTGAEDLDGGVVRNPKLFLADVRSCSCVGVGVGVGCSERPVRVTRGGQFLWSSF
jgi:hypothetical protein